MRKLSIYPFLLLFVLLACKTVPAQMPPKEKSISINMSASELLPADLIIFNININAEGDSPREAFEIHKKRESVLADLLKKFDIDEEDINFQPVQISKRYSNNGRNMIPQTNQQVSVSFNDFKIYEEIQVRLIENGFDSFNASFSSSKLESGKLKALESAIASAKERAQLIAKASGVKLGSVINISYSDYQVTPFRAKSTMDMEQVVVSSSMMDFDQTVSVTANINIEFAIL